MWFPPLALINLRSASSGNETPATKSSSTKLPSRWLGPPFQHSSFMNPLVSVMNSMLSEYSTNSERAPNGCRKQHLFPLGVTWLGVIASAGVITIVFVSTVRLTGALLGLSQNAVFGPMVMLWVVTAAALGFFYEGHASRSLGIRRKDRRPQFWKRAMAWTSMTAQLKLLRIAIAIGLLLPILASLIHASVPRIDREIPLIGNQLLFLFGWLAFMLGGFTVWISSVSAYRESQEEKIRASLRFHHRGVALRSFISEWDNTSRDIYRSCRLSRRLAAAHRTIFLTIVACFSMAGCLAALADTQFYVGELLTVGSAIAIAMLWPTPSRLVHWSAEVLDPYCADREEYEEY